MNTLPYIDDKSKSRINILIVLPKPRTSSMSDGGVFMSADLNEDRTEGTVIHSGAGSSFRPGDNVVYKNRDRTIKENIETIELSGIEHDIIGEGEVWEVNGLPYNRVFIEPLSDFVISAEDIFVPENTEGITQKGRVFKAPANFFVKDGDTVEYRKNTKHIYHTAVVNGKEYDILYGPDIFLVNGLVSPHKIIVKIDLAAQRLKRQTSDQGLALSPLFQHMTRMLQYGYVSEIGSEAQKMYPELKVGDTAILHHSIEYDEHRLIGVTKGKFAYTQEFRIINCFDVSHREIFGVIKFHANNAGLRPAFSVIPFHKNVFLKWNFELLEKKEVRSDLIQMDFSLLDCKNKEDLENVVSQKREASVHLYKSKFSGYNADLARYNPTIKEENDKMLVIGAKIAALKRDAEANAKYVQKDHVLRCKISFPIQENNEILTNYKTLYPINILGSKFLIAHSDLIIANMDNNNSTGWKPLADRVLVQPETEQSESAIFIPESAQEKPQNGKVIAVGKDIDQMEVQEGDSIMYRKVVGTEIVIDGTEYLVLKRNDILLSPTQEMRGKQKETNI